MHIYFVLSPNPFTQGNRNLLLPAILFAIFMKHYAATLICERYIIDKVMAYKGKELW